MTAALVGPNGGALVGPNGGPLVGPNDSGSSGESPVYLTIMTSVNSSVKSFTSPTAFEHRIDVSRSMTPCALFLTGLGSGDTVYLQMFIGTDDSGYSDEDNWVTIKSGGSEVSFTEDDNQYIIEAPGAYRLKSTTDLASTSSATAGALNYR